MNQLRVVIDTRGHSALFADANSLFALILEPTNQPLCNNHVIIGLYGTINNINGGVRNELHMLHASCDAPQTKLQCSRGADLLTLSETSTWLESKLKRQATASVKVRTLDPFYQEHIIVCK